MSGANPYRGEAEMRLAGGNVLLRPTFSSLLAAEGEIGPLFALVDRAASGKLGISETIALLWHCRAEPRKWPDREAFSEAVMREGIAHITPALKALIAQILLGRT